VFVDFVSVIMARSKPLFRITLNAVVFTVLCVTQLDALASSKMFLNIHVITIVRKDFVCEFVQGLTVDRHVFNPSYCSARILCEFK
jgi:hypothetical protein